MCRQIIGLWSFWAAFEKCGAQMQTPHFLNVSTLGTLKSQFRCGAQEWFAMHEVLKEASWRAISWAEHKNPFISLLLAIEVMDKTGLLYWHWQHLLNCALGVTVIYTQFMVLPMATSTPEKANWKDASITSLIKYFGEHKAEGGKYIRWWHMIQTQTIRPLN